MIKEKMKKKFKFIFVVLTYRNADDLYSFNKSLQKNVKDFKVIIVNSFYDRTTEKTIKNLANIYKYDFISVPNKGYGAGNNIGIKYALDKYEFDFLVVSNSDILIKKFDVKNLPSQKAIIGPKIITLSGKQQNPYWWIENKPMQILLYEGFKRDQRLFRIFAQAVNRGFREFFLKFKEKNKIEPVYALHGSFLIFSYSALEILKEPFDSNMFLFYEEAYLASLAKKNEIHMYYDPQIIVIHKEDGSTEGTDFNGFKYAKSSYIYYYENKNI